MTEEKKPNDQHLQVDDAPFFLPDNLRAVSYCNNIILQFSPDDFSVDFLNMSSTGGIFVARVALTPSHMKRFSKLLNQKIEEYEKMFGEISENTNPLK